MNFLLPTELPDVGFAVTTRRLLKRFGSEVVIQGVDLQVPTGAVYVLIGPNGAGKSTTLKLVLNLLRADGGTVEVFGVDVAHHGPLLRSNIGYVPESQPWGHRWMTVGRLLEHHATYFPAWDKEYGLRLAKAFALRLDKRMRELSKGQVRLVHLVLAIAHRPALLILDEPTDGLDPVMRSEALGQLTSHIAENPTTIILSTHQVHEVEQLADHVGILQAGRLTAQLRRDTLCRKFRQYSAEVPDGWTGASELTDIVLQRRKLGREIQWNIWGEEHEIMAQLSRSGAVVRGARPLSLEEATVALLGRDHIS